MCTKLLAAILGAILTGCLASAPVDVTDAPVDLGEPLGSSDGLVVGSILVSLQDADAPPESDGSLSAEAQRAQARGFGTHSSLDAAPSWMSGQAKTDTLSFLVRFEERRSMYWGSAEPDPSAKQFSLVAVPLEEKNFVVRLPAGSYRFLSVAPTNSEEVKSKLGLAFEVTPARATYVGRLVIPMPERVRLAAGESLYIGRLQVDDVLDSCVAGLKRQHPTFDREVDKRLMIRE